MFERYTESARRALFFARYAVGELGAVSIQTEHLLFGLLRQKKGIVARMLEMRGIDPEAMRREIEQRRTQASTAASMEVPFDSDVKRALEHAREEADGLHHSYIGTEHLLLGLLRDEQSVAGSMLAARGLHLDDARELVVKLLAKAHLPRPKARGTRRNARTRSHASVRLVRLCSSLRRQRRILRTCSSSSPVSMRTSRY